MKTTIEQAQEIGGFGYWEIDIPSGELKWSNQVYNIFRLDPELFKPSYDAFLNCIHPEDRDKVSKAYSDSLKSKEPYEIQHRILFSDDSVGYVLERCDTYYDDDGNPLKSIGSVQDITDSVQSRMKLEESEKKFKAISNQTTEGITVADMDGNYVFVNPAFCKMSGYTEEELLTMTVFNMKAPDQDHSSFKNSKEKMEGAPMRVTLMRKDGVEYITEIIGDVIHVDNQELVLGTIRDITERVKAENEILKLNENLECIVKERTEELNKTVASLSDEVKQRTIAEEETKDSLNVKEVLLQEVTHRVKNSLQIISSLINLQKSSVTDDTSIELLNQVSHRIQAMALIHEILYKSNEFERVDFQEYIDSLIFYAKETFKSPNIEFVADMEESTLSLDSATNCGMIIMELITNSIKYGIPNNSKGKITIGLSTNNDYFILTVADNGVGFPDDIDFKTTKTLGMQLVVSLTEQLDGEIELTNEGGSSFKIVFPIKPEDD